MVYGTEVETQDVQIDQAYEELQIVAYINDLKVVGRAHVGVSGRASSRRSSDYIRSFPDKRITLSDVRVYRKGSSELFDASPFMIINMDAVDLVYARETGFARPLTAGLQPENEA